MKKLLTTLAAIALMIASASCSKETKYDAEECTRICDIFDTGASLSDADASSLITQEGLVFDYLLEKMKSLTSIADSAAFIDGYKALDNDTEFIDRYAMSERIWRVLVLSQSSYNDENMSAFNDLSSPRQIIDLYNDEIYRRTSPLRQ